MSTNGARTRGYKTSYVDGAELDKEGGSRQGRFNSHLFRSAGILTAANARVPDSLFKRRRMADWGKDGYTKDWEEDFLSASPADQSEYFSSVGSTRNSESTSLFSLYS